MAFISFRAAHTLSLFYSNDKGGKALAFNHRGTLLPMEGTVKRMKLNRNETQKYVCGGQRAFHDINPHDQIDRERHLQFSCEQGQV